MIILVRMNVVKGLAVSLTPDTSALGRQRTFCVFVRIRRSSRVTRLQLQDVPQATRGIVSTSGVRAVDSSGRTRAAARLATLSELRQLAWYPHGAVGSKARTLWRL